MMRFGLAAVAGMALASGAAGSRRASSSGRAERAAAPALVTGAPSITVGVLWSIPLWSRL
jgi:hypothetical protein